MIKRRISKLSLTSGSLSKHWTQIYPTVNVYLKYKCDRDILTQHYPCVNFTSIWERWGQIKISSMYAKISQYYSSSSHYFLFPSCQNLTCSKYTIFCVPALWITWYYRIAEWEGMLEPSYFTYHQVLENLTGLSQKWLSNLSAENLRKEMLIP